MKSKTSLLFGLLFFFIGNLFSQSYNIKWGNMEKQSGRLQSVLPISGSDFYTLRWSGGALLGSLRLSRHDNLSLTATGKLVMQVDGSIFPHASAQEHMDSGKSLEAIQDW